VRHADFVPLLLQEHVKDATDAMETLKMTDNEMEE